MPHAYWAAAVLQSCWMVTLISVYMYGNVMVVGFGAQ